MAAHFGRELHVVVQELLSSGAHAPRTLRHDVGPYRFLVSFTHSSSIGHAFHADNERRRLDAEEPDHPTTLIQCVTDPMVMVPGAGPTPIAVTGRGRKGPGLTEEFLERWAGDQGLEVGGHAR